MSVEEEVIKIQKKLSKMTSSDGTVGKFKLCKNTKNDSLYLFGIFS